MSFFGDQQAIAHENGWLNRNKFFAAGAVSAAVAAGMKLSEIEGVEILSTGAVGAAVIFVVIGILERLFANRIGKDPILTGNVDVV